MALQLTKLLQTVPTAFVRVRARSPSGRGAGGLPIVVAPVNDSLGLAITEGIEDALSVHEATGFGDGHLAEPVACQRWQTPCRAMSRQSRSSPPTDERACQRLRFEVYIHEADESEVRRQRFAPQLRL